MPFSKKYNLLFIHIPRCGGTSIEKSLEMFDRPECGYGINNGKAMQHYFYKDYIEILGRKTFNQYYKFSIVRHPYSRFISEYHWCEISYKTDIRGIGAKEDQSINDFIFYCEDIIKRKDYYVTPYHDHIAPQHKFIYNDNDKLIVNKVFRFESYHEVEQLLKERCGVTVKESLDTKGTYDSSFCLTEVQKNRIYAMYQKDFDLLGYSK